MWPELHEILEYREHVCKRITVFYSTDKPWADRSIGRALWIGFAGLHLETFFWMSMLSPNILPPPTPRPDFMSMAERALRERVENQWFSITDILRDQVG